METNTLKTFNSFITNPKTSDYLTEVLKDKKNQFVGNLTSLVANNKNLQECNPSSLMYSAIKATNLNLPLEQNLGFAYVLPYKNNKSQSVEAQFQIGYKGFIQLAIRSGLFVNIEVAEVLENETAETWKNRITYRDGFTTQEKKGKIIGYCAYFKLTNGFEKLLYMDNEKIEEHAKKYSQSYKSNNKYIHDTSIWNTNFDSMAKKTVLKLLLSKYAPLNTEMIEAQIFDQAIISEKGVKYVDNDIEEANSIEITEEITEKIVEKEEQKEENKIPGVFNL